MPTIANSYSTTIGALDAFGPKYNVGGTYSLPESGYVLNTQYDAIVLGGTGQTYTINIGGTAWSGDTVDNRSGLYLQTASNISTVTISTLGVVKGDQAIFVEHLSSDITNHGTVSGGESVFRSHIAGTLTITNHGQLASNGIASKGVWITGSAAFNLTNTGIIRTGLISNAFSTAAINSDDSAVDTITNTGRIEGSITLNGNSDVVNNAGVITGQISLGAGDDQYFGTGAIGPNTIDGGSGSDFYYVNTGDIVIDNTLNENDEVRAISSFDLGANARIETLRTSNDSGFAAINLTGSSFAQNIFGNAGNNIIDPGTDTFRDVLLGGEGNDTYVLGANLLDEISELFNQFGGGIDTVTSSITRSLFDSLFTGEVENLTLTGTDDINGTGNGLANVLRGNTGSNLLDGGAESVAKTDTMIGGLGDDDYIIRNASDAIIESVNQGVADRVRTFVTYKLGAGDQIEFMQTDNSSFTTAINLTGNEFAQTIFGNAGANILDGGIETTAKIDTLSGNLGNDTYIVRNASEIVNEVAADNTDRVRSTVSYTLNANADVEILEFFDRNATTPLSLSGNNLDQTINGNKGINTLRGFGGADVLDGGLDLVRDVLLGGLGDDQYIIRSALDDVVEITGQGTFDSVTTAVNFTLQSTDNVEDLRPLNLMGTTALQLTGNDLAQRVTGNIGNNVLSGRGGADTLDGFKGADVLTGGTAKDTFVFTARDSGQTAATMDKITDYTKGAAGDVFSFLNENTFAAINMKVGGSATASANVAKIDNKGVATFAANSGLIFSDAVGDVARSCTVGGEAAGEFGLFRVNNTGNFHLFISDGIAGLTTGDVVVELQNITGIGSISLTGLGLAILT